MTNPIGPLTAADEGFCHQIIDTFAVVGSTDLSWTEKVCAMAAARDGSLQLGFGLGKYNNRNVMDAYAGTSRGVEQITVRASRRLSTRTGPTVIGPIRYEVVEPLRPIRFVLEPNDVQPIAFDWLFEARLPPQFEDRTHLRAGNRVVRRARALSPDRPLLGLARDRRRTHRDDAGHLGVDAGPLLGRPLRRRRSRRDRPRTDRRRRRPTTSSGRRASWNVPTAAPTACSWR